MITNPDKFQTIILSKNTSDVATKLTIYSNEIETTNYVKLLGVKINCQIKFFYVYLRIPTFSKAMMQLNALYKLQRFMYKTEKTRCTSNHMLERVIWDKSPEGILKKLKLPD